MKISLLIPRPLVVLVALLVALLSACSSVGGGSGAGGPSGAGGASGTGPKVAFVSQVEGIPYFAGFKAGAEQAAQQLGLSYTQAGPATADSTEQLRIFNSLVSQGYQAIAISPLDPNSMNPAIAAARKQGVHVITADADAPGSEREVFVQQATDQDLGFAAMDQLAQAMGGSGQYGIISGAPDTQTFNSWSHFIQLRQQTKYPDIQLVGGLRYTASTAQALQEAQNLMTAYPGLKGIIAVPSTAVPGVAQAVRNAGKTGQVAVTGFGSPKTAAQFVDSGVMASTVLWDVPKLGQLTVWAMKQILDGKSFAQENSVPGLDQPVRFGAASRTLVMGPPTVFTKANIGNYNF
ncbi:MAG TPA: autoinducer 2 ABC transporter substrate-binding protein [Pseudonocardia sp.]|uniref:autoinducer 2 ABC transporter substrate-binding protein n=1 Tax=Pseudonocardia sp. TaxID=60912 RepID=UPI002ED90DEB